MISSFSNDWRARSLFVLAVLLYATLFQGARPIYSPDEGRYTDVALGMIDDGDWLRPMLHPEFEHWSKPPITYWAIAGSVELFGRNEFAARLPNSLAFAATIFLLIRVGRKLVPAQYWLPALIYATFIFPLGAANIVTTDTLLSLFETAQLAAFVGFWWQDDERSGRLMRLAFWLAAAIAFLTKGPPGLLILGACLVFAAVDRGWRGLRLTCNWDGLLLFAVVGGSWYGAAVFREPDVLRYFFVEEVVNRVASDKMHRNAEWYGGFKIYIPTLLLGTLPWLPFAIARVAKRGWKITRADWKQSSAVTLLGLCIVLPLIVFMVSRSRLPLYVLPLFAPFAVLFGYLLAPIDLSTLTRRAALAVWCVVLIGGRVFFANADRQTDDRLLSTALMSELPVKPDEVAFVDTAPRYGVRFYLGSSIERLTLPGHSTKESSESLTEEMTSDEGCRVLMANPTTVGELEKSLDSMTLHYRRLADEDGYAVILDLSHTCPAFSLPPA
jgi:4-amino-4-deoxy-L-arabinose transferase-like glycosyltransferase